ncbi:MAG: hypothetical protein NVS9B10_03970 [Nevskia sp.]
MRLPAALLLAGALAACGQTGPLHLPGDAPSKENYLLKRRAPKPAAPAADPVPPEAPAPTTP